MTWEILAWKKEYLQKELHKLRPKYKAHQVPAFGSKILPLTRNIGSKELVESSMRVQ